MYILYKKIFKQNEKNKSPGLYILCTHMIMTYFRVLSCLHFLQYAKRIHVNINSLIFLIVNWHLFIVFCEFNRKHR